VKLFNDLFREGRAAMRDHRDAGEAGSESGTTISRSILYPRELNNPLC
jgi:hypothetical protein